MIGGRNLFDQPVQNPLRTYNIRKITTGQGGDYTTDCPPDYHYFKENYNLTAIDLAK